MSALRADLRELRVSSIALNGDAHDVAFKLPEPRAELLLSVAGEVAGASVKRPAHVPVDVEIDGGAHELSLDGIRLAAITGVVRQRTRGGAMARWRSASAGPQASSPWLPTTPSCGAMSSAVPPLEWSCEQLREAIRSGRLRPGERLLRGRDLPDGTAISASQATRASVPRGNLRPFHAPMTTLPM